MRDTLSSHTNSSYKIPQLFHMYIHFILHEAIATNNIEQVSYPITYLVNTLHPFVYFLPTNISYKNTHILPKTIFEITYIINIYQFQLFPNSISYHSIHLFIRSLFELVAVQFLQCPFLLLNRLSKQHNQTLINIKTLKLRFD